MVFNLEKNQNKFGLDKYSFYLLFFFAEQFNQPFLFVLQFFRTWWQHCVYVVAQGDYDVSDVDIMFSSLLSLS